MTTKPTHNPYTSILPVVTNYEHAGEQFTRTLTYVPRQNYYLHGQHAPQKPAEPYNRTYIKKAYLKSILYYWHETGDMTHAVETGKFDYCGKAVSAVRTYKKTGNTPYVYLAKYRRRIKAADAVWCLHTDAMPIGRLTFANGDSTDIRIENLLMNGLAWTRYVWTPQTGRKLNGKHVSFYKRTGRWRAYIGAKHIGYFDTEQQASDAAVQALNAGVVQLK